MKKIIIILTAFSLIGCGSSTPDEATAKEAARAAIIHNLKDPSSAEFHQNEKVKDLGNNTFEYTESVNATNSFGGKIAQDVNVQVKWNGGDPSEVNNWSVVDIHFLER